MPYILKVIVRFFTTLQQYIWIICSTIHRAEYLFLVFIVKSIPNVSLNKRFPSRFQVNRMICQNNTFGCYNNDRTITNTNINTQNMGEHGQRHKQQYKKKKGKRKIQRKRANIMKDQRNSVPQRCIYQQNNSLVWMWLCFWYTYVSNFYKSSGLASLTYRIMSKENVAYLIILSDAPKVTGKVF